MAECSASGRWAECNAWCNCDSTSAMLKRSEGSDMTAPPYRFHYGEPSLFVEIYLPKKARYQGVLYKTLTNGFNLETVKNHLIDRRDDVRKFLKDHEEFSVYTTEQVNNLSPSYNGYSLYELDGVFRSPPMPAREYELDEERVQVFRLMFLPPTDRLARVAAAKEKRQLAARRYMHFWTQSLTTYLDDLECYKRPSAERNTEREIATILNDWLRNVGLFLHGYILFELCEEIGRRSQDKSIKPEQEIWLTAFRGLAVVKTTLEKKNKKKTGSKKTKRSG